MFTKTAPLPVRDLDHVLDHTRDLWGFARGKRFFLTGGTGFFGVWLLETFCHINRKLGLGMSASVLTRSPELFAKKFPWIAADTDLEFLRGDIRSFNFPQDKFDGCIHAATEADPWATANDPLQVFNVNVLGTQRVLEFARNAGVKRFLFTSSGAVYGRQPPSLLRVPEDYTGGPEPTDTKSAYGIPGEAKRAAESLCAVYAHQFGLEAVIARCFTFVGPHLPLDGKFAVGNFIRDAISGGPIRISGDGSAVRSYLYAADLAAWLWTLLFKGRSGCAYNVGADRDVNLSFLAKTVADVLCPGGGVTFGVLPRLGVSTVSPNRYVPSIARAKAELQLDAWISLEEALTRTEKWARNSFYS
jgi:dTDP-glucose 4,6-dehydratase